MAEFRYTLDEIFQTDVKVQAEDPAEAVKKIQDYLNGEDIDGIELTQIEGSYWGLNKLRALN